MKATVKSFFYKNYGTTPLVIKSPGRINIIGEHTDYNLGFVLPAAIDKGIYFAVQKNNTEFINIETFLEYQAKIQFSTGGYTTNLNTSWGKYIQAMLQVLEAEHYAITGFDCAFGGDIPIGAGLSSSAALCCGFLYAVSELFALKIPKKKIALLAQKAEHKVGLNCGLMDQYAVLFGKRGNTLFLDCKNLNYLYVPVALEGYSWILINSNIKHELAADSGYNERRKSCEHVVHVVKDENSSVSSLRDVDFDQLERIKNKISKTDYKRAKYVLSENERVEAIIKAFQKNDALLVGKILFEGHWALSKEYDVSTPKMDALVVIAQQQGVLGARMMGGGFGGCTINLIQNDSIETVITSIISNYKIKTGITAEYYQLKIDDGISTINH